MDFLKDLSFFMKNFWQKAVQISIFEGVDKLTGIHLLWLKNLIANQYHEQIKQQA